MGRRARCRSPPPSPGQSPGRSPQTPSLRSVEGGQTGPSPPLGVHAGNAYVGLLGEQGGPKEMTALGDDINVGARLADNAGVGEVLASVQLAERIGLDTTGFEHRELRLKGKTTPFEVVVVKPA